MTLVRLLNMDQPAAVRGRPPSAEVAARRRDIAARYSAGENTASIAALHGLRPRTVLRYAFEEGAKRPSRQSDRNTKIVEAYRAGKPGTELAGEYGITRERVYQILRRGNEIEHVAERKRLAREAFAEDAAEIKAAAKRERRERMDKAIALVRDGKSHAEAGRIAGLTRREVNLLSVECRAARIPVRFGRWQDKASRKTRVRELVALGCGNTQIIDTIRAEGDPIHVVWLHHHFPELVKRRRYSTRVKVIPVIRQNLDSIWTDEKVSELRRLWIGGASAQQISDIFGPPFTRNAIIGKVGRLRNAGQLFVVPA